ncbi:MAG: hypothetical protein A2Z02_02875, partial [Chloroflexi bacterium RBG_16_48_7]
MTVRVVTDSGSDIDPIVAKQLGITIVPTYVLFGEKSYRDGVDINADEFYEKLSVSKVMPRTAIPSPGEFMETYRNLCKDSDEIVSIHITRKHSSILEAASLGRQLLDKSNCRIEIIDSGGVTIWQGMVAIAAAKTAASGGSLQEVVAKVHETIDRLTGLGLLSTLRYAIAGGRVRGPFFRVESVLPLKVLLTIRAGEVRPVGLVRNWVKGIERLHGFVRAASPDQVYDIALGYNTSESDLNSMLVYVKSILPRITPRVFRIGPTLGA